MTLASRITSLLTALTRAQVTAMSPAERQLLSDQLERVHSMIETERVLDDAREATREPSAGVLALLRRGDRAP
jgi:hypothetical protein